jgi:excisionase family DNA binding protein
MTTQEAAEALGIHRSRVLHYIGNGRLRAVKVGRDWWLTAQEVERFKALPRIEGWQKGKPRK